MFTGRTPPRERIRCWAAAPRSPRKIARYETSSMSMTTLASLPGAISAIGHSTRQAIECSTRSHAIERTVQYLVDPAAHRWHPTHVVEIPVGEHEQRHAFNPQFSPTPLQLGWFGAGVNECDRGARPHKHRISLTDIAQCNRPLSRASRRSDARGTDRDPERHRSAHRDC